MPKEKIKIPIPVVVTKEKVRKKDIFVASCPVVDIASQGKTTEEGIDNLKDALNLYWQEPESKKIISFKETFVGTIEISISKRVAHAKTSNCVRA